MAAILAWGGYVPRLRLSRRSAVEANAWFAPALAALSRGERSMCNWDEDTLTLAVEAGRDCLGAQREGIAALHLASTTAPFADRQNAALVAGALGLDERIGTMDIGASQRAGTSGLINAFAMAEAGKGPVLLVAAEDRLARAGGAAELRNGAGAAALLVGEGPGAAELVGREQSAVDFVDHFRSRGDAFDYAWEERWVRDAGWLDIVPRTLKKLLGRCAVAPRCVDHFVMPCTLRGVLPKVAARVGLPEASVRDPLDAQMGEAGAAHPLVLLAHTLESAGPGELILLAGFGQGCDALLLRTTERVAEGRRGRGIGDHLARRREETHYGKFLAFNRLVEQDTGMRAEAERPTLLSTLYRNRSLVAALVGGKCRVCGTAQLPRSAVCVNPNCGDFHTQDPYPFAERPATVLTWTADRLTWTPDPPAHYGIVQFEGGGRLMADFTDVDPGAVEVGMRMRMMFRIKERDARRNFTSYFWKAAPA